jgi:dipeptidyl aminopeptidase/acylaminoacyl peptidase
MHRAKQFLACIATTAALSVSSISAQTSAANNPRLTIDQLIEIKHPSNPIWSPDNKHIAFIWDRTNVANIHVVPADGHTQPIALTSFREGQINQIFWNRDSQIIYFARAGSLWQVSISGGPAKPAWSSSGHDSEFTPSPDFGSIAIVRRIATQSTDPEATHPSDLIIRSLADGAEKQIAHDDRSIRDIVWSPDSKSVAYTAGAKVIHHDETPAYSGAKIIYRVSEYVPGQIYAQRIDAGKPVPIAKPGEYGGLAWIDANHLTFDTQANQYKNYFIYVADAADGALHKIYEIDEDKFWSIPDWGESGAQPWPSPNGKWIAFLNDKDGWDHLYVMPALGGTPAQITKGRFDAWRPVWSHDSTRIAFDANEPDHLGDRHIGIANIGDDPAHGTVTYVTTGKGTNIEPHWSPDDKALVYQHTDTHDSADLFAVAANSNAKPVRLTDSMPPGIDHAQFVEPEFVRFPGADGQQVLGWLFVPQNLDRTKKHPAIIWVHGDGVNQNYDGWHVQRNYAVYYSFHQYLLQQGYVVFAPDYRGSIGYGRDWRNGVHMDVGGNDAKDAWMSANYLKTLPYVDPDRIGIWGLSYGGFFTLIAMTDQPTLFRCGVDVAGVVDYIMYYNDPYHGDWTVSRIGTPEQNPKVYAQASPISHIDRLERPLLVLHGTPDVNVPYLESVWLIDEALKKGKGDLLTFMMYPGEFHYFAREHVLRDAWHRVDDFFALHLRNDATRGR